MRFDDPSTFRQALEREMEDRAGDDRLRSAMYRRHIVFERLLARLAAVAPGQWALTGDFALDLRKIRHARNTWQLEFEWQVDHFAGFREAFHEIANRDMDDFFELDVGLSGQGVSGKGASSNFTVQANLAGSPFESAMLHAELRFGEIPTETIHTEGLLDFAGLEPVEIQAVPLELQVAEKVYHYVYEYQQVVESRGAADLLDLSTVAESAELDPNLLRGTIAGIFRRHSAEYPGRLQPPPAEWAASFSRIAKEAGVPVGIATGHDAAAAMLDPVLAGMVGEDGPWSPDRQEWAFRPEDGGALS
jgi:hypothetical protein